MGIFLAPAARGLIPMMLGRRDQRVAQAGHDSHRRKAHSPICRQRNRSQGHNDGGYGIRIQRFLQNVHGAILP